MTDKEAIINTSYWNGKKVLITGHTGFKGSWLTICLRQLGCKVVGLGLRPNTIPNLFEMASVRDFCDSSFVDIRDRKQVQRLITEINPEVIFHLAAQAIVYDSYIDPLTTFETNIIGTANILESVRTLGSVETVVVVTSDKVYEPKSTGLPFEEGDALGGYDPYSASKAASELVVSSYSQAFLKEQRVAIATARAGNVIGGGDWGRKRLIPDAVRAWSKKEKLIIRNPDSIRPWQHVLEPLYGYILLAQKLSMGHAEGGAYNFGPGKQDTYSVKHVATLASSYWPDAQIEWGTPTNHFHESSCISINANKSLERLGFRPRWNTHESIFRSINWYREVIGHKSPIDLCVKDIELYWATLTGNDVE